MRVWPFLVILVLCAALTACCPAPLQGTVTAFRAEVVGVSPEVSALHLKTRGAPLLTLSVRDGVLRSSTGPLPLTSLQVGESVYVQGTLREGDLLASVVRRLE